MFFGKEKKKRESGADGPEEGVRRWRNGGRDYFGASVTLERKRLISYVVGRRMARRLSKIIVLSARPSYVHVRAFRNYLTPTGTSNTIAKRYRVCAVNTVGETTIFFSFRLEN